MMILCNIELKFNFKYFKKHFFEANTPHLLGSCRCSKQSTSHAIALSYTPSFSYLNIQQKF